MNLQLEPETSVKVRCESHYGKFPVFQTYSFKNFDEINDFPLKAYPRPRSFKLININMQFL